MLIARVARIAMTLINCIAQIQFKFGAIGLLKEQFEWASIRRALMVSDRGVKAAGIAVPTIACTGSEVGRGAPGAASSGQRDSPMTATHG
ncbi:hypothetical protein V4F39_07665 [Aquincola sp. MAHUQ-54]|uniref:Uncharacterized protein n=1 Tax=Aquincola agrisoli TaxID=3119538 RepID=A0AAW9Q149_9BURK